jgi:DNA gyrase/topoisomerase IV subunit B
MAAAMLSGCLTIGPAALQADQLDGRPWRPYFHGPMRDKVEPRREYIEKHALEARNLDV